MKGKYLQFALGVIVGGILFSTTATAADYLTARPASQPVYVDGKQVQMEAYVIHENNFMKLRDVGEAVGFNVYWDGKAVQIESDKPYTGEAPAPAPLTEESVQATIRALRDTYPTGTYYGPFYRANNDGPYGRAPTNCAGWATLCSDAAFGDLPWRTISNPRWEDIRAGDLIRYDNNSGGHVVVVLERKEDYIKVTESGTNNKVRWGGQYFRYWLEERSGYTCFTRYPE